MVDFGSEEDEDDEDDEKTPVFEDSDHDTTVPCVPDGGERSKRMTTMPRNV